MSVQLVRIADKALGFTRFLVFQGMLGVQNTVKSSCVWVSIRSIQPAIIRRREQQSAVGSR